MIAELIFIEEVENQPGFIYFKVEEGEEDGKKYNTIKAHEDELLMVTNEENESTRTVLS